MITTYYGLTSSNRDMNVTIQNGAKGGILASINQVWNVSGSGATLDDLTLYIDKADFNPSTGADGENTNTIAGGDMYDDRILAHEMVHAVMADTMCDNFYDLAEWFKEGTAEFIPGADSRLKIDIAVNGGSVQNVIDRGFNIIIGTSTWGDQGAEKLSTDYSTAYLAVKYLEENLVSGKIMKDVMHDLTLPGATLNTVVTNNTGYADVAAFATALKLMVSHIMEHYI